MNVIKKELAIRAAQIIRKAGYRKVIKLPKHSFVISDNCGNSNRFDVTGRVKKVTLDEADVAAVIEACLECIYETLARGDAIKINGLGVLGVKTRAAGKAHIIKTGEIVDVPERRLPYFAAGSKLKAIARSSGSGTEDVSADYEEDCFDDIDQDDIGQDGE